MNKHFLVATALFLSLQTTAASYNDVLKDYSSSNSTACKTGDSAMMASWSMYMSTLQVNEGSSKNEDEHLGQLPQLLKSIKGKINSCSEAYLDQFINTEDMGKVRNLCDVTLDYLKQILASFNSPSPKEDKAANHSLRKYLNNNLYYC